MSATEIVAQIRNLPPAERRDVVEQIRAEFAGLEDGLTAEQIAELDRRADEAFKNPHRGKPAEQVFAELRDELLTKK